MYNGNCKGNDNITGNHDNGYSNGNGYVMTRVITLLMALS